MRTLVSIDEHCYLFDDLYHLDDQGMILVERYLNVYDTIKLVVRVKKTDELNTSRFKPLIDNRVEIYPIYFFQGYRQYLTKYIFIEKKIKDVVKGCEMAIVRLPSTIGFQVLRAVRRNHLPHGIEIVANPKELYRNSKSLFAKLFYYLYHLQQLKALKYANAISYVTKYSLQQDYPVRNKKSFITYYSSVKVDNMYFCSPKSLNQDSGNEFVICHVAHPIKTLDKGHKILIDIVKDLNARGFKNVVAKFAGAGEYVPYFIDYAEKIGVSDKISFVGLLSTQELFNFLKTSDLMVFPTVSEGLPRVLIEAMAVGLPCLSTRVGGIPELLSPDLLFGPYDVAGFVNKIIEIMSSSDLYHTLSIQSCAKSKEYEDQLLQSRRNEFFNFIKSMTVVDKI